jgi:hypothetical protein
MARLVELTQHLRKRIFRYLLVSDRVRQPHNHLLIEHYAFEVNLLRVSTVIKKDAEAILYGENKFVKLTWFWGQAYQIMQNHEVPFFHMRKKRAAHRFDHHVAEVTVRSQSWRPVPDQTCQISLLLLDDIPKLARTLQIAVIANFLPFVFEFKLRQPDLPLFLQEKCFSPFEQVRGGASAQHVTITGPVDSELARRVKQSMTQQIQWLRCRAWEIYDLAVSISRQGDLAFRLGNADMALAKYDDARTFADTAVGQNHMVRDINLEFDKAMVMFFAVNCTNVAHLVLSEAVQKEIGKRVFDAPPNLVRTIDCFEKIAGASGKPLSKTILARFYYLLGIAELGRGHPNKAGKGFAKSYKISTQDIVKEGYDTAKAWPELTKRQRQDHFDSILAKMPNDPVPIADMTPYRSPMVAPEHWVMRQLGCKGPIPYEDTVQPCIAIVLTSKPHQNHRGPGPRTAQIGNVYPHVLKKMVDKFRAQMKDSRIPVTVRPMCWVSLQPDQIGEESILDDPEHAAWIETMGTMMRERMRYSGLRH